MSQRPPDSRVSDASLCSEAHETGPPHGQYVLHMSAAIYVSVLEESEGSIRRRLLGEVFSTPAAAYQGPSGSQPRRCNAAVQIPRELFKAEGYAHKEALFGIPVYGGFIAEKLYYSSSTFLCSAPTADEASTTQYTHTYTHIHIIVHQAQTARGHSSQPAGPVSALCPANSCGWVMWLQVKAWQSPFILMADRGNCTFVTKVRHAQHAGASGVLVADNVCLCSGTDYTLQAHAQLTGLPHTDVQFNSGPAALAVCVLTCVLYVCVIHV